MIQQLKYRLRQRWLPGLLAVLTKGVLTLLGATYRLRYHGVDEFVKTAQEGRCILMFWHSRLAVITELLKPIKPRFTYAAVVSYSRDGEIIAKITESYKEGRTIRVPHNARSSALREIIREAKNSNDILIITPDGPRGPLHTVKPGVIIAAREAQAKIIPLNWKASRCWKLRSWDQMEIPKPFSTIDVTIGSPIELPKEKRGMKEDGELLREALLKI